MESQLTYGVQVLSWQSLLPNARHFSKDKRIRSSSFFRAALAIQFHLMRTIRQIRKSLLSIKTTKSSKFQKDSHRWIIKRTLALCQRKSPCPTLIMRIDMSIKGALSHRSSKISIPLWSTYQRACLSSIPFSGHLPKIF